jgi:hypothetical protein
MIFQCHTKAHIKTEKENTIKSIDPKEDIANCIFHPNENIVITLSFNNAIGYWDAIKTHLIYKKTLEDNSCPSHDIACSPYGKHLLIMKEKECIIIPVPAKIIWYNRMPYLFFLLKQSVSSFHFPIELMKIIMQNIQHGL